MIMECKVTARKSHYPKDVPFEVPEGWVWSTLGESFNLQAGKFISANDIHEESSHFPYRCFGGNGIRGYVATFNRTGDYPIIGRQGALCGNINYASGEFYATEHAVVVESFGGTNTLWARYLLEQLNLNQYATATAQPGLSVKTINEVAIPIPPVGEQQRIATAINRYIGIISDIQLSNEELQAKANQAKSHILNLAIHGKLVPQDPSDKPAICLLRRINPDFQASHNLHYAECPSGWAVAQMESIIDLISGRDLENSRCNTEGHGVPYLIGASCIDNSLINIYRWTDTPEVISKEGDVLLSCKGTVGEVVLNTMGNLHIARQFMAIRSKAPQYILPDYLGIIIKASIETLKKAARGIIPGISREDILGLTVMIPPSEEQQRILSRIAEFNQSVSLIVANTCN